ncbi:hypothetical protein CLOM_g19832 [Closterium sp. NIES-68]|nr:hypothetical protein CLOM_g19832 [Closterium sp. NIES-68]GJP67710.1 hypothetical protein CLOP_g24497 [Closterium sp. NIES-67]GJP85169.1 hypothetical protein CLOP_g15281 [Closterium sp. NIES-67]
MDAKVLSFGDVLLRECDVATLEPSQWLNDKVIEFYFEYLSRTLLGAGSSDAPAAGSAAGAGVSAGSSTAGGASSSNGAGSATAAGGAAAGGEGSSAVLLVGPSVSFWLNICPSDDDVTETMAPLGVEDKELIALAVNDNNDPTLAEAGSHWSLLLFVRSRRLFLHFDSAGSHNLEAAKGLAEKLQALLGVSVTPDTFQSASTPQQLNGYDCGVYVLAIAKALCETASASTPGKASAEELENAAKGVDAAAVTKLREDVKLLIRHLGKQSE